MNGARDKFLARATFACDKHWGSRVFKARNHTQDILNVGGCADDAIKVVFGVYALSKEFDFADQADYFGHALEKTVHFLDAKRLFDVVVGAKLHGIYSGLDRTVAGHNGYFRAREERF